MNLASFLPRQPSQTSGQKVTKPSLPLESIRIASPCRASWEKMAGDDRVRYCQECKLNVYNLSEMTRTEAERLIASREGRLCVRFYRRADGTMITQDCPKGLRALIDRVSRIAGAVLSAMMAVTPAFAQSPQTSSAQAEIKNDRKPGQIWITVFDIQGAAIQGATITLKDEKGQKATTGIADASGRTSFSQLSAGFYTASISAPGFETALQPVRVGAEPVRLTVTLQIGATQGAIVEVAAPSIPTQDVLPDLVLSPYRLQPEKKEKKKR
jgi:hypothetical protein